MAGPVLALEIPYSRATRFAEGPRRSLSTRRGLQLGSRRHPRPLRWDLLRSMSRGHSSSGSLPGLAGDPRCPHPWDSAATSRPSSSGRSCHGLAGRRCSSTVVETPQSLGWRREERRVEMHPPEIWPAQVSSSFFWRILRHLSRQGWSRPRLRGRDRSSWDWRFPRQQDWRHEECAGARKADRRRRVSEEEGRGVSSRRFWGAGGAAGSAERSKAVGPRDWRLPSSQGGGR